VPSNSDPVISNAHQEAFDILTENRDVLDDLVRALFEKETLDREQVAAVFQPLRLWPKRPAWTGSDERVPSSIPPVTPPPPISVNGQNVGGQNVGNGHAGGQAPSPEHPVPAGGTQQPPGHQSVPSQLPAAGESDPQPHRGPDFR
jgi:cell division protease FtsH